MPSEVLEMSVASSGVGVLYLVAGLVLLGLLHKPIINPEKPGSTAFAVTIFGCALWPLSLGTAALVDGTEIAIAAWSFRLLAPSILSVGWFLLALQFTTAERPPLWVIAGTAAYVTGEVLLVATNSLHGIAFDPNLVGIVMAPDHGTWFWTQAAVNYVLMVTATVVLAGEAVRTSGLRRNQSLLLASATIPAGIANAVTIFGLVDVPIDLTPFGLVGSALVLTWALYRARVLEIVPIARNTAVEEMQDAVVTLDVDGRVIDCNQTALTYFRNDTPVVGMPATAFFSGSTPEDIEAIVSRAAQHTQLTVSTADGDRHFDCTTSAIDSARGGAHGYVIVLRDVTDQVRREQQLIEQNETLTEFSDVVSHDVQGPLMQLRASASLAERTGDSEAVDEALHAVNRMDKLVEDLLELARSGKRIADLESISLATVADAAWRAVHSGETTLTIEDDLHVQADPDRLQQLLENLFRNAVEHAGPAPSVCIGPLPDGFYVEDDGPGIPPADRERIFETGVSGRPDGTGFGLRIVQEIADAHGWEIRVTEGTDDGARFEVTSVAAAD